MNFSRLGLSVISLIVSIFLFVMVTFAWITSISSSNINPLTLQTNDGLLEWYEVRVYVYDRMYKYDSTTRSFRVYNPSQSIWEVVNTNQWVVTLNPYDPLISINNAYNNVIIEFVGYYRHTEEIALSFALLGDSSRQDPNQGLYSLSRVASVQKRITDQYAGVADGTNLYLDLTASFQDTITFPFSRFYDAQNNYQSRVNLSTQPLTLEMPKLFFVYFNLSYDALMIQSLLSQSQSVPITGLSFYPDIAFEIQKTGSFQS
jgi:hypothetical protein